MDRNIVTPVYQPIVSLRAENGYRIVGHEMLTRFKGLDTQATIRSLEKNGQIAELERQLVADAAIYSQNINVPLSLNISNASISTNHFIDDFEKTLSAIKNANLNIEITETHAPNVNNLIRFIEICHSHNIKVGLDDYGSGHANMTLLEKCAFDFVKIDGSVTKAFDSCFDTRNLLIDVLAYTAERDLPVTIEYLEKPAQMLVFESLGIDKGQGYLFGEPRPTPYNDQEIRNNMLKSRLAQPTVKATPSLSYGS